MDPSPERFISQLLRRWCVHRAIDFALVAMVIAAAISLPAAWGFRVLIIHTIGGIAAAGIVGISIAVIRRPTPAQAASLADDRLNLHDLLGSTTRLTNAADADFFNAIRAQAMQVCQRIRARDIAVDHGSAASRFGALLLVLIAMNAAWLMQPSPPASPSAPLLTLANVSPVVLKSSPASLDRQDPIEHSKSQRPESAGASEREFTGATEKWTTSNQIRGKAGEYGRSAQTADARAEPLPKLTGKISESRVGGNASPQTLAAQLPTGVEPTASLPMLPIASHGTVSAAAPAEYRDLIGAYFTTPSH